MTEKQKIEIMSTKLLNAINRDIKVMTSDSRMQAKIRNCLIKMLAKHK